MDLYSGIVGAIAGAFIAAAATWYLTTRKIRQDYYINLVSLFADNNAQTSGSSNGLLISDVDSKVALVCYNHLNILLYVYFHRSIVTKDKTLDGWKNWTSEIIRGAQAEGNEEFRTCYRQILTSRDLYPKDFIAWLETKLDFSINKFHEVVSNKTINPTR